VEVRVQGHDGSAVFQREGRDFLVGCPAHPDFSEVCATIPGAAQAERSISRNALVEDEDAWLKPSGSVTFRGGVLEISGGECQSLPDVLGLKLRIILE